jgi:hypothetical protein
MDLSAATLVDPNGILNGGASSLGTTSTIALNNVHGLWDAGLDGLGFFFQLGATASVFADNAGVVLRVKFVAPFPLSPWRIALGADANAGPAAWTSGGFMGSMLQGSCHARRDQIGDGGSSGTNLGGNTGTSIDTFIQWNPLSTGNAAPAIRGILVTVGDATLTNFAQVGAGVTPAATLTAPLYAVLGIGNGSAGAASTYNGVEASYQLIPRQP